jgi:malate synthase
MEDAATVEIIRSQVWQELLAPAWLDDGSVADADLVVAATRVEADLREQTRWIPPAHRPAGRRL